MAVMAIQPVLRRIACLASDDDPNWIPDSVQCSCPPRPPSSQRRAAGDAYADVQSIPVSLCSIRRCCRLASETSYLPRYSKKKCRGGERKRMAKSLSFDIAKCSLALSHSLKAWLPRAAAAALPDLLLASTARISQSDKILGSDRSERASERASKGAWEFLSISPPFLNFDLKNTWEYSAIDHFGREILSI